MRRFKCTGADYPRRTFAEGIGLLAGPHRRRSRSQARALVPMRDTSWPAAPRPFADEAFGGWSGRVAGRYGITVGELGAAANTQLDLNLDGSGWLAAGVPAGSSIRRLADRCRLAPVEIEALAIFGFTGAGGLSYCYRCLILNPQDVFSPYWRGSWLNDSRMPSPEHLSWVRFVSPADMMKNRNLPWLLKSLELKSQEKGRQHRHRN